MELRVSQQTIVNTAIYYEQQQTAALAHLQAQASSGNRILAPEDDPLGTVAVINYTAQDAGYSTDLGNINTATQALNVSVSTLQNVHDVLTQAKQLGIQGGNATNDATSLASLGDQVNALFQQLVTAANAKNGDQYVFGGTRTQAQPFVTDSAGNVTYAGASQRASIPVGSSQAVDTYYAGSEVFQPPSGGATVYNGNTGAEPGTGLDTATGQGTLTVTHTTTTYAGNSGVAAGTDSAAGDTIIGPAGANTLTFDGAGHVALNGGPPVAFTSSDKDLKLTDPKGEVAYVDTTGVAGAYSGTVNVTANGTLSAGGGSGVPINFSGNQVVTGADGTVTNVDSTNVRQAGSDTLTYGGALNAFQVLQGLRDDLLNTRGLSQAAQLHSISNRLGELSQVDNNVLRVVGRQSASLQNLTGLQSQVQDVQLQTKQLSGGIQSADMASVLTNLQAQQNLLQATLDTTAKVFSTNLLDFIK
jgi:flagellar hook-associated protein 3 FlgL